MRVSLSFYFDGSENYVRQTLETVSKAGFKRIFKRELSDLKFYRFIELPNYNVAPSEIDFAYQ
jgi:hypothetical protein